MPATLDQVLEFSPFARRALEGRDPALSWDERLGIWEELVSTRWDRDLMEERLGAAALDAGALPHRLREMRRDVVLSLLGGDALGRIGYPEVVRTMSDFAEFAIDAVVGLHARELARRFGVPRRPDGRPVDLLVVGMGKLGGRELNVSSDIDLIFLYSEDGETAPGPDAPDVRRTISNQEFFERLARRVIPALNDVEDPGFVFRVDMRLRPNGESGPIVDSLGMLENYLYSQGRDWERFAWIKGRVVNRPVFGGEALFEEDRRSLASLIRPFVFRKYLDFDAITSLTRLHEMIRAETARREVMRKDGSVNVKLGRGGIREIEFIVQTQQAIRGGRDASLRGEQTLPMIRALESAGVLSSELARELERDYVRLRDIEHAIQYVEDQQTQRLPCSGEGLERVAGLLDTDGASLWKELDGIREAVASAFDGIFQVQAPAEPLDAADWPAGWEAGSPGLVEDVESRLAAVLSIESEEEAAGLARRVFRLVNERDVGSSQRAQVTRERLMMLVPRVAELSAGWIPAELRSVVTPAEVFSRYLHLLEVIVGRSTYVALLAQYPSAMLRVGRVLAASRWCADYLVRHPIVLDDVVTFDADSITEETPVDYRAWSARLRRDLDAHEGDQERQMNQLRDLLHSATFQLLIADLNGRLSVERLADHLSALADAVLEEVVERAWKSLSKRTREHPKLAVVGYGKLGGRELGYDSDLDLVFIYDDPDPEADVVYSRLVRRMMSWLTLQTSSGNLFDVDLRLRPNGESGLVVTPFSMFCEYQRNELVNGAWFWEHQALTRARFCAGDAELGGRFEAERADILAEARDPVDAAKQVTAMRWRIMEGHHNPTGLFDIKYDDGGMVDVEFCVQYLVLVHAHRHPDLIVNSGNIKLLARFAELGLLPRELAESAAAAYRRYRALQHEFRLNAPEGTPARFPAEGLEREIEAVLELRRRVLGAGNCPH